MVVAAVDRAVDRFLQAHGVQDKDRAITLLDSATDQTSDTAFRQRQRWRVEVDVCRQSEQKWRLSRQSRGAAFGGHCTMRPSTENLQSVLTASPARSASPSAQTHRLQTPAPTPVELDMVPYHIIENSSIANLDIQAAPINGECTQAATTRGSTQLQLVTLNSEQSVTSLSSEGRGGHTSSADNRSRSAQEARAHPTTDLLPSQASAQTHPSAAYSILDVFDNWRNPVLKRKGTRQQSSCDALRASHADADDTSRQVGGGEHVRIASLDGGAAVKRQRRVTNSTLSQGQEGIVNAKRVAADVKLNCASLQKLRVCGQFDCRIILCTLDEPEREPLPELASLAEIPEARRRLLIAVDQHAADERVQLERLTASVYGEAGDQRNLEVATCDAMWAFDTHEHPKLLEHANVLRSWGFTYTLPLQQRCYAAPVKQEQQQSNAGGNCRHTPDAVSGSGLVHVHTVPRIAGVVLGQVHLRKMLSQLDMDAAAATSPGSDQINQRASCIRFKPTAVSEILAYRACHSAVRFGDQLTHDECCRIISELAQCRLPFQCAHGRPTLHPIMAL